MISRLRGVLVTRELDRVEVETSGGVVYEVEIPLTVFGRLPERGSEVEIRTVQVVREDAVALYGFLEDEERTLFRRLLTASGVGPRLAVAMLSAYPARRLARALAEKDLAALKQIAGVGKKTAERLILELSDKVEDLALGDAGEPGPSPAAREAVSALVALGYTFPKADETVNAILREHGGSDAQELIRLALESR